MSRNQSLTNAGSGDHALQSPALHHTGLSMRLLGGFELHYDGARVADSVWRLSKARTMVQLLALSPGFRVHREQLLELLWPELDTRSAAGNLYQVVHAARRALNEVSPPDIDLRKAIQLRTHVVAFSQDIQLWVDVLEFEREARQALATNDVIAMRTAAALYRGDLLPEYPYDEWIEPRRQLLRDQYLTLLIELGQLQESMGNYPAALDTYKEAAALDPINEQTRAGIMRVEALLGQRASALKEFQRLENLLTEELGVEPDIETRHLRDHIAAGHTPSPVEKPGSTASESSGAVAANNLPVSLSSFVGRDQEIVELGQALTTHRLVTVSGPGGSGKSRLALEVATKNLGHFRDGVFVIPLVSLSDPAHVVPTIAQTLSVRERPDREPLEALQDCLVDKQMLLLLDNFEHLLPARDAIAQLLVSCPRLTILVTSRNVLRLSGEKVFKLAPLPVPDWNEGGAMEQVEQSPSVRLFLDRARSVKSDFELSSSNAAAVIDVCQRLDGLPLAIELAAARIRVVPPVVMARRLDQRLSLLAGGASNRPMHQQSLRNTIAWSYELLSPAEQALFRRLAAFRGGWTLDAAEAVTGRPDDSGIQLEPNVDAINGSAALLDASLIAETELDDGDVRFTMLETIREYALEQLQNYGEAEAIARRHAWYFLEHVETVKKDLNKLENVESMRGFERDYDNLRAALHWFHDRGMSEPLLRFTTALTLFWYSCGHWSEARDWFSRALAMNPDRTPMRGNALAAAALFSGLLGDREDAQPRIDEAIATAEEFRDHEDTIANLNHLGVLKFWQNDLEFSRWALEQTLAYYRQHHDYRMAAYTLRMIGELSWRSNDLTTAAQQLEESARISRESGNVLGLAHSLNGLGDFYRVTGRYDRAEAAYRESLELFDRCPVRDGRASAVQNLGYALNVQGKQAEATRLFHEASTVFREHGDRKGIGECLIGLAGVFLSGNQPIYAARLLGAAQALFDQINAQVSPSNEQDHQRILSQTLQALGKERFTSVFDAGYQTPYEDLIDQLGASDSSRPDSSDT